MEKHNDLIKWVVAVSIVAAVILVSLAQNFDSSKPSQTKEQNDKDESISQITTSGVSGSSSIQTIRSPYIKEYQLPDNTSPNGILVDKEGTVWVAGSTSNTLISFDPKTSQIKSVYQIKESNSSDEKPRSLMVWSIVEDNEGMIWFSQMGKDPLWQFNPKTAKFTSFHSINAAPFQMKVDKKTGNVWFTTLTGKVGIIQKQNPPQTYKITEFDVGSDTYPSGLFLDDSYLWITQIQSQKLAKFSIITDNDRMVTNIKKIFEIPQNDQPRIFSPTDILRTDDFLWITEHGTSFLTRYDIVQNQLERFPTSVNPQHSTTLPFWIRQSADGDGIWFNEHTGNRIAFFDIKNIMLSEYEIPSRPIDGFIVYPLNIATDITDSNKVWFSEWNTNKFGVLDIGMPAPFDIRIGSDKIVLGSNQTAELVFEITKTIDQPIENNFTLSFMTSGSMTSNSEVANMTTKFLPPTINLSNVDQSVKIRLVLQNNGTKQGNYTLGISATDGIVTKSIFLDLIIVE